MCSRDEGGGERIIQTDCAFRQLGRQAQWHREPGREALRPRWTALAQRL